jgi:sugar lactone lactonase YvrE
MAEQRVGEPRVLLDGLAFGESPRWHDGRLWVSDWGAGEVIAVDLEGHAEVVARVRSFPMCIDFLPDGRLLVVSAAENRLLRQEADGAMSLHADLAPLSTQPWNDIVVDGRGNAYVDNIGFKFPGGEFAPGLVAVVGPDGSVREVAGGLAFPNGMAVTPDRSTLIVAESYAEQLTAFDIGPDGSLGNRRTWAETKGDHPDGVCIDAEGAAWYADVGRRHCVRVREGGEVLQSIEDDRGCFACCLGGPDGRTLFIVDNDWKGPEEMRRGVRASRVLAVAAPAARAGRP